MLVLVVGAVFLLYGIRLFKIQVIDGKSYLAEANKKSMKTMPIEAARGEITDRFGRPMAVNRMGYSIIFDRSFMVRNSENTIITYLVKVLSEAGETWNDDLPITGGAENYSFLDGKEKEIEKLKKTLRLNEYATAQNCIDSLFARYEVNKMTDRALARTIAGVRYEMEIKEFSITNRYTFSDDVSMDTVSKIKEHSLEIPGVDAQPVPIREYVSTKIAPHIIGTVGPIYQEEYEELKNNGYKMNEEIGKSGIEKAMEQYLHGKSGVMGIEQNAAGYVTRREELVDPKPGGTVVLTLDKNLQEIAQNSLAESVRRTAATSKVGEGADACAGAVAVVDLTNGEALALVTYPSYDLATYKTDYSSLIKAPNTPLLDRSLMGLYEPGSTMKPGIAVTGLAAEAITAGGAITCNKEYPYFGHTFKCLGTHGNLSVTSALEVSCNVFFYETSKRLGIEKMNEFSKLFGLGQGTGIEILEANGVLAGPEYRKLKQLRDWSAGDTVQAGIGQSDNVFTPIQLANYCATVANGGTRYRVHLVKEVRSYDMKTTIYENVPEVLSRVEVPEQVFKTVHQGMYQVANGERGTARGTFAGYKMKIAGKTGTAQVAKGSDTSVFIGFAPYDNPKIAVAVVVEHGYKGTSTTEVARDIFDAYFYSETVKESPTEEKTLLP